jgi:outer membrane protein assembly factor BamB
MSASTARAALVLGTVLALLPFGVAAPLPQRPRVEWPMMGRDATRNNVSPEKGAPVEWSVEAGKLSSIKWVAELGGGNNSASPVVSGGLVWIGTNNAKPHDPNLKEDASVLMCFRESDGKFLWQYVSPRLDNDQQDLPQGCLNCSPLVEDDRLYFTTNRAEVICLDVGPLRHGRGEPRVLWAIDMRRGYGVSPVGPSCGACAGYLCSLSTSYRGRLYVTTGNGVAEDPRTAPAPDAPSLLCLDRDTGKVLWSDRSPGKDVLHSQWSSPLVVEVKGRAQVIAAQGDGWVRSFDAISGELLWKFDTNPKAAVWKPGGRGTKNYLPATPVFYEGRVYIANGLSEEYGPGVGHLWCIDPARTPANPARDLSPVRDNFDPSAAVNKDSGLVWHHGGPVTPGPKKKEREYVFGRTMCNVAIHDGLVIAADLDGYVDCLDARSGRRYWTHDMLANITASPLVVDGKVYVASVDGTVAVLALSREKRLLATNEVDDVIRASPVFANGVLYVATRAKLFAIKAEK